MERLFSSLIISFIAIVFTSPSFAGTTCGPPIGEVVSFQAMANGRYVTADKFLRFASAPPLVANRDWSLGWEQFEVEDAGGGYIALKALANNLYVSAGEGGLLLLLAAKTKSEITDWERFFWISNTDGTVSLMLKKNGRYVTADKGFDANPNNDDPDEPPLVADRTWIRDWEKFIVTGTCPTSPPERFVDNGDGTITDNETGLMWEKKIDDFDDPDNPHNLGTRYTWTDPADGDETNPDGTAFTVFLATLNQESTDNPDSTCFAGYCDWRIPRLAELRSIRQEPCSDIDCIDPIFGPTTVPGTPGPPRLSYMSSTSSVTNPLTAWVVIFSDGFDVTGVNGKTFGIMVRAVRGGR
jgi:hypothetical protein